MFAAPGAERPSVLHLDVLERTCVRVRSRESRSLGSSRRSQWTLFTPCVVAAFERPDERLPPHRGSRT